MMHEEVEIVEAEQRGRDVLLAELKAWAMAPDSTRERATVAAEFFRHLAEQQVTHAEALTRLAETKRERPELQLVGRDKKSRRAPGRLETRSRADGGDRPRT